MIIVNSGTITLHYVLYFDVDNEYCIFILETKTAPSGVIWRLGRSLPIDRRIYSARSRLIHSMLFLPKSQHQSELQQHGNNTSTTKPLHIIY